MAELEKCKKDHQDLKKKQDKLMKSEKLTALSDLVSDIAHEINNPLMVISGRVELSLMENLKDEGVEANFKIIRNQCNRVKDIVRKLLVFSKPSKGTVSSVSVNDLLEAAIESFDAQSSFENIVLEKNFSPSLTKIELDGKQIQDVFINLIQNSVEAMSGGGKMTISTAQKNKNILIDFSDTGCGILPENMKEIFNPFFTTKEENAGLGLSMCYGIVKIYGGDLRYESVPNQGTTATLVLPIGSNGK